MTRATRGFSLIEVTVAIAVIGTVVVATSALLQRVPISGREIRDQDLALKIARDEIEVLRAGGYSALPADGPFTNDLLASLPSGSGAVATAVFNAEAKEVTARVTWQGESATRSVSLTTLIASTCEPS